MTAALILAALAKFIVWEAALFAASVRLARLVGWGKDHDPAEWWLAVIAIDVTLESTGAALFSFARWNSILAYAVVAVLLALWGRPPGLRGTPRSRSSLPYSTLMLAALLAPLILLSFKPVEEIDSINYLHYLLDWMANRATPFTFATNYVAFWELSFLPAWTITRVDLFFPLLALKSVALVALGAWLIGSELGVERKLLLWTVAAAIAMRHYWFGPSGTPTLKNDALHGAGFLLLALVLMRRARGPLARSDIVLLSLGAAFATVKYTGIFLAAACLVFLWRVALWPVLLCLVTTGPYYMHNLIRYGSPFYPFQINLGPLHLPGTADLSYTSILYSVRDPMLWRLLFLPAGGVSPAGVLFPVTLAAMLVAGLWYTLRGVHFLVGQAPRPAGDPQVALRPSGTRASRADLGVCPTKGIYMLAILILLGWFLYFRSVFSASAGMGDLAFLRNSLNTIRYVDGVLAASEVFLVWLIGRWAWPLVIVSLGSRLAMLYAEIPRSIFPPLAIVGAAVLATALIFAARRWVPAAAVALLMLASPLLVERNRSAWTVYWNDLKPALAGVRDQSLAYVGLEDGGYFAGHVVAAGNPVNPTVQCLTLEEVEARRPEHLALMVTSGSEVAKTWREKYEPRIAGWGYRPIVEGSFGALYARR